MREKPEEECDFIRNLSIPNSTERVSVWVCDSPVFRDVGISTLTGERCFACCAESLNFSNHQKK